MIRADLTSAELIRACIESGDEAAWREFVRRFRTEASTAAVLQHPNIVAVHEVGVHDGRHFFSMDFVEGQNLAQLVGQHPLEPQRAARYRASVLMDSTRSDQGSSRIDW